LSWFKVFFGATLVGGQLLRVGQLGIGSGQQRIAGVVPLSCAVALSGVVVLMSHGSS
jgi:hypothetical protein